MHSSLNVHVRGVGTIGEPLVNMLLDLKRDDLIGEVTFSKKTASNIHRVKNLILSGAKLVSDEPEVFEEADVETCGGECDAIRNAHVVLDCTPTGGALSNIDLYRSAIEDKDANTLRVISQGSENDFGTPFVAGVNRTLLEKPNLVQIKSCNTTAMSAVTNDILEKLGGKPKALEFTCIRRANDIYQPNGNLSVNIGTSHGEYGSHHAEDVRQVLISKGETHGYEHCRFKSSAIKVPTQFMHVVNFSLEIEDIEGSPVQLQGRWPAPFQGNKRVAFTDMSDSCQVFAMGRDYGYMGRVINQAVVPTRSINMSQKDNRTFVSGSILTPQDANTLLSSISATLDTFELMDGPRTPARVKWESIWRGMTWEKLYRRFDGIEF